MKNKEKQLQEQMKTGSQASLKQTAKKLNSQADKRNSRRLTLRFSPTAWAKLLYFRDKSDNEVGGFGITEPDDLLFITDFITVKQQVSAVSIKFDDNSVADLFDDQVDFGRKPEQFARIWLHTHPGDSPEPSVIDEETFERVFGSCEWAVMFVLARDNKTYAKLSFNTGPGAEILIPVEIEYSCDFGATNKQAWDAEYNQNIKPISFSNCLKKNNYNLTEADISSYGLPYDFLEEFEKMEPAERQFILDELAERPELWDEEQEVMCL